MYVCVSVCVSVCVYVCVCVRALLLLFACDPPGELPRRGHYAPFSAMHSVLFGHTCHLRARFWQLNLKLQILASSAVAMWPEICKITQTRLIDPGANALDAADSRNKKIFPRERDPMRQASFP